MVKQGGGAIVNVASVNAFFQPDAGTIDYGAAKAALVNLTKSLSQEFGPRGIRINSVSPGTGRAPISGSARTASPTRSRRPPASTRRPRARTSSPASAAFATGRFTTPEEVATLVVMLASERTANVTGANYVIDGGLIKTT